MATLINNCKGGIVCRNLKRMWKRTAWDEVSGNHALLEPKILRFSFGLLIYTSYRFTTIYGRLPQDF